jgi:exopolysaccharide biosynthesis polyprenyl glycosylphosphotransferase
MYSPKKESCTKLFNGGADAALLMDGSFDHPSYPILSAEALKARDRALPDRLVIASLIMDSVVIIAAMASSHWLRFHSFLREVGVRDDHSLQDYASYIALGSLAFILSLAGFGIYERSMLMRYRSVSLQILKAAFLWTTGFISLVLVLQFEPAISRVYIAIASLLTPAALLTWRWIFHRYLGLSSIAAKLRQRVLFVGWNAEAQNLARLFIHDPNSAYEVVGCIRSMRARFQRRPTVHIHGSLENLVDVIHRTGVDVVVLADVQGMKDHTVPLANVCERELVQFKVVPSYFQIFASGLHLETVSGIPILGVSRLPLDRLPNALLKRAVDLVGALVGLIFSIPLMMIFGALVYLESPGPIFYRQRRIGRNGAEFFILKIRSMRLDAEASGKIGWSTKDDPRRLRVGTLIRRWNIDEVPQFLNVLLGEMSLVGPRPERPELIRNFKHEIPHYNARHGAKPGITGWAQVKGLRGDTDLAKRINCDLWYLENWNPLLDFQIMFMTFFGNKNAA